MKTDFGFGSLGGELAATISVRVRMQDCAKEPSQMIGNREMNTCWGIELLRGL